MRQWAARLPRDLDRLSLVVAADYIAAMNVNHQEIVKLRADVETAREEFDLAVAFHEAWKPTAYDEGLRQRMGVSYATNTFNVVRVALRREMLLALMRIWDKTGPSVRMDLIAQTLRKKDIINALAADRAARFDDLPGAESQMRKELQQRADEVVALIAKYSKGGSHGAVRDNLKTLRDKRLAHREVKAAAVGPSPTDEEIESFYQDTSKIVRLLLSLVIAHAYDPQDAALVFRRYAKEFWAAARGERTEGHPNYRAPPPGPEKAPFAE